MSIDPDRIRQRAYDIWIAEGCPTGKKLEHWERAEQELRAEANGVSASDNSGSGSGQNGPTGPNGVNRPSEENTPKPALRKRLRLNPSDDHTEA